MEYNPKGDQVLAAIETEIAARDRVREKRLPFSWIGWDQYDTMVFGFTEVYFHKDFGVFKQGEKIASLSVDYGEGTMTEYAEDAEDGTELRKQNWTAWPISEP